MPSMFVVSGEVNHILAMTQQLHRYLMKNEEAEIDWKKVISITEEVLMSADNLMSEAMRGEENGD